MSNWLSRTKLLIGSESLNKLQSAKVAVIGLGGVGGAAAEALCRAGIGNILLMDNDDIEQTNLNRQILATTESLGERKCDSAQKRLKSINPNINCTVKDVFYLPETREELFDYDPDYIIDAIDTVTAKLDLIETSFQRNIPILSSMGTGNRLKPDQLCIGTIEDTAGFGCGLSRVMRRELRRRNISGVCVLYSKETPLNIGFSPDSSNGRHSPGSISFVPPVAGYILASEIVRKIIGHI